HNQLRDIIDEPWHFKNRLTATPTLLLQVQANTCNILNRSASAWMMKEIAEQLVGSLNEFLAFARGRLGEPELAADAVQESLLKALRNSGQVRDEESVKAWFYRILRRTIVDVYRSRGVHQR